MVVRSADKKNVLWTENENLELRSDCACSSTHLAAAAASREDCIPISMQPVHWKTAEDAFIAPVGQGYNVAYASTGGQISLLAESARVSLETYRQPHRLDSKVARALVSRGLLQPLRKRRVAVKRPTMLTGWLHVTSACNLGCSYCYVVTSPRELTQEMGESAIKGLFASARRHSMESVKIKYAGGEPMLRFNLVRNLHERARELAAAMDMSLDEVVLTNGTLVTEEHLHWARAENVDVMISLDGVGEIHDRIRRTRAGDPTFSRIVPVIDAALRLGVRLYLSTTVSTVNVEGLAEVVAFTLDRGILPHLNLVRTLNPDLMPTSSNLIRELKRALAVIRNRLPLEAPLVGGFFDLATFAPRNHPCGAGQSYVAIGPDGGLHSCQMSMGASGDSVGGSRDLLDIVQASDLAQGSLVEDLDACQACPWRYVCAGGCPLMRRAYGHFPYCDVYQAIVPELLRLEGARILALVGATER